eukprot:6019727-Ditylum_brightwellii.AAC.1
MDNSDTTDASHSVTSPSPETKSNTRQNSLSKRLSALHRKGSLVDSAESSTNDFVPLDDDENDDDEDIDYDFEKLQQREDDDLYPPPPPGSRNFTTR